ncbi:MULTISPECIES: hypothetical protein [unclassified Psychrobacillus]|uniref:hypothetical protein n=1 Tax=unclassified Psychrobacillus TaxID=2636677 RepID=UPI0030FCC5B7
MTKRQFKSWFSFMFVIIIVLIAKSLWKNEEVYWGEIVTVIIAGLVGGIIGIAGILIIKIFKKLLEKQGL